MLGTSAWRAAAPVTRSVRLTDTHGVEKVFPKERKRMVVCRPSTLRWGSRNGSSPLCFNEKLKLSWLLSRGQILSGKIILRFNYSSPLPPKKTISTLSYRRINMGGTPQSAFLTRLWSRESPSRVSNGASGGSLRSGQSFPSVSVRKEVCAREGEKRRLP